MRGNVYVFYVYHHNNMICECRFNIIQMPSRRRAEATFINSH